MIQIPEYLRKTMEETYFQPGESMEDPLPMLRRVAKCVAGVEAKYGWTQKQINEFEEELVRTMSEGLWMCSSPYLMNAGTPVPMLLACFVLPIEDDLDSIYQTLWHAAKVHKMGGGTGFDFSKLRAKGAPIKSTGGTSSGVLSFLNQYDCEGGTIKQGGRRRAANLGALRVDHPEVLDFIDCKKDKTKFENFNLSVLLPDWFMQLLDKEDDRYPLMDHNGSVTDTILSAREVFRKLVQNNWEGGEPGALYVDQINKNSKIGHLGRITATNPCVTGETLVTTDKGLQRISDLVGTQPKILSNDGKYYKASQVIRTGNKVVYKLTTRRGYTLNLTEDHKVYTDRGWIEAKDLNESDILHLQNTIGSGHMALDKEFGRFLGLLVGDGFISRDHYQIGISIRDDEQDILDWLKPYLDKITGNTGYLLPGKGCSQLRYKSKYLYELVINSGCVDTLSDTKVVPEQILTSSLETQRAFLNGLFTADGSFCMSHATDIRLSSVYGSLISDVQRLLLNNGIASTLYYNRDESRIGRESFEGYTQKRAYHEIVITKDNKRLFKELISFSCESKITRLEGVQNKRSFKELYTDSLESLVKIGTADVYDLTEPVNHCFYANGLLVHNCGEIPLLPYEACNLASINLDHFVKDGTVDWDALCNIVKLVIRFQDDAIDASVYPTKEIEDGVKRTRKLGLGIMGLHGMLIQLGLRYDSEEGREMASSVMEKISNVAAFESMRLAEAKGVPAGWYGSTYQEVDQKIRNLTRVCIAPTGTISMIVNSSASGCEPIFAVAYTRNIRGTQHIILNSLFEKIGTREGWLTEPLKQEIIDNGGIVTNLQSVPEKWRNLFVTAGEILPEDHVKMQAVLQKHVDNSISKTVNMPEESTIEDIEKIYKLAWELGCKGITMYRAGSREGVLNTTKKETTSTSIRDTSPGVDTRDLRPSFLIGATMKITSGCGKIWTTINPYDGTIWEVFSSTGSDGGCTSNIQEISRLISLSAREKVPIDKIIDQLKSVKCARAIANRSCNVKSCSDAIARQIEEFLSIYDKTEWDTFLTKQMNKLSYLNRSQGQVVGQALRKVLADIDQDNDFLTEISKMSGCRSGKCE